VVKYPGQGNREIVEEFCGRINGKPVEPRTQQQLEDWIFNSGCELKIDYYCFM
jgi:hypothetical protein